MTATVAALPDLADPSIVGIGFVVGAILGTTFARLRRLPREDVLYWGATGGWAVGLLTLLVYLMMQVSSL